MPRIGSALAILQHPQAYGALEFLALSSLSSLIFSDNEEKGACVTAGEQMRATSNTHTFVHPHGN